MGNTNCLNYLQFGGGKIKIKLVKKQNNKYLQQLVKHCC